MIKILGYFLTKPIIEIIICLRILSTNNYWIHVLFFNKGTDLFYYHLFWCDSLIKQKKPQTNKKQQKQKQQPTCSLQLYNILEMFAFKS